MKAKTWANDRCPAVQFPINIGYFGACCCEQQASAVDRSMVGPPCGYCRNPFQRGAEGEDEERRQEVYKMQISDPRTAARLALLGF